MCKEDKRYFFYTFLMTIIAIVAILYFKANNLGMI